MEKWKFHPLFYIDIVLNIVYDRFTNSKQGLINMKVQQKKTEAILVRVTPDMRKKINEMTREMNCTVSALLVSMIEHCFSEMENNNEI